MKPLRILTLVALASILSGRPSQSLAQQSNNAPQNSQTYSGQWVGTWTKKNSPNTQASTAEQGTKSDEHTSALREIWEWIAGTSAQGVDNFLILAATIAIAIFNFQLAGVTKDMSRATKAQLHSNRPFVLVTNVGRKPNADVAYFIFENFGNGPADIVEIIATAGTFFCDFSKIPPGLFVPSVTYEPQFRVVVDRPIVRPNQPTETYVNNFCEFLLSKDDFLNGASVMDSEVGSRVAVYGRISYRGGAPDEIYLTHFFWWWFEPFSEGQKDGFFMRGPSELNKRT